MDETKSRGSTPDQHGKNCVICLEAISELGIAHPCGHTFDFLCVVNWLERTPTCPLCKTEVKTVHYGDTNDFTSKIYDVPAQPAFCTTSESTESISDYQQGQQEAQEQQVQPNRPLSNRTPSTEDPLSRRRSIYSRQLYSLHVGSNQISRFQELTPKRFRKDEALISKARKWIRRELQIFSYLERPSDTILQCGSKAWWIGNPEYLLEWIIAMLKSVNIKDSSGKAEDMLQEILGRSNARLFLHELRAWLRSPFHRISDWDQNVQYNEML